MTLNLARIRELFLGKEPAVNAEVASLQAQAHNLRRENSEKAEQLETTLNACAGSAKELKSELDALPRARLPSVPAEEEAFVPMPQSA